MLHFFHAASCLIARNLQDTKVSYDIMIQLDMMSASTTIWTSRELCKFLVQGPRLPKRPLSLDNAKWQGRRCIGSEWCRAAGCGL
jgi:hypothetical protein